MSGLVALYREFKEHSENRMTHASSQALFTVEQLTQLGRVVSVAPSPCGQWLAVEVARLDSSETRYLSNIWKVSLDRSHAPVPLTRGTGNNKAPCFRRDGSLGFLSERSLPDSSQIARDDKLCQVWLMPVEGGEPRPLTEEPLGVSSFRFASNGDRLVALAPIFSGVPFEKQHAHYKDRKKHGPSALHYHSMPVRFWDHWLQEPGSHVIGYNEEGEERRDLTPEAELEHREASFDVSPDGSLVAVTLKSSLREDFLPDQSLLLIDVQSGGQREVGATAKVVLSEPSFSTSGNKLACLCGKRTAEPSYEQSLWVLDVLSGEGHPVASSWDRWPSSVRWSEDDARLFVTADDKGHTPIFQVSLPTEEVSRLSAVACAGTHGSLCVVPGQNKIVGIRHQFLHPPEPFAIDCEPGSNPLLLANLSGFAPADGESLAQVTSFRVESDDGVEIQSFLLKPQEQKSEPSPWLLWIHGGPMSQWRDGWHWRWNPLFFVAQGYAVALPNPRGSTGEGQEFIDGIWNNEWGGRCFHDLIHVTEHLTQREDLDSKQYAAMGGSFGGYMVNWMAGHTERFRCFISHAGLYHFPTFFGTTDMPAWFAFEKGLDPFQDREALELHSPHRRISKWKTPTLVIHGEKDYRVPVSEALMLFNALQMHNVPSELLVFPDENHWILKPRNIRVWYKSVSTFLKKYI